MRKLAAACLVLALAVGGVSGVASADDEAICTADGGRPLRACLPSDVARSDVARSTAEVICPPGYLDEESNGADLCTAPGKGSPISAQDAWESYNRANDSTSASARSSEARADTGTRAEPTPYRTITEGQSTTFTAPVPSDRQPLKICVNYADGDPAPTPRFRSDGTLVCTYAGSTSTWGVCRGPYTVELTTADDRVEQRGRNQIRVTTDADDGTDDSGTLDIDYFLRGTRTETFTTPYAPSTPQVNRAAPCELYPLSVRLQINPARRAGMTAAVAMYAPSREYLSTPSTVTWTCTQEIIDEGVQCDLNTVISTTTTPSFPTPRRCRIVVTVAENGLVGHGSTACLTSGEAADFGEMIGVDIATLPTCPLSTRPDDLNGLPTDSSDRQRCVARN